MKCCIIAIPAVILAASNVVAEADAIAAERMAIAAKAGGMVEKPGSSRGRIVFINTQREVDAENIRMAVKSLGDILARYRVDVVESAPAQAGELKAKFGADVAVVVADEGGAPALLAAPEEGWSVVNVRALQNGLKTEAAKAKFLDSRCRKEIMRGFACAAGGIGSGFPGNIMNVAKVEDLDLCEEFMPFDKTSVLKQHLKAIGVTPGRYATYRVACREGWAPAPTNDVQKAIWEKVHALPTEPIKIKPETKKIRD